MINNHINLGEYADLIDDDIPDGDMTITTEYLLDGATTLTEAAEAARAYADYLVSLEEIGYQLIDVITGGEGTAALDNIGASSNSIF